MILLKWVEGEGWRDGGGQRAAKEAGREEKNPLTLGAK